MKKKSVIKVTKPYLAILKAFREGKTRALYENEILDFLTESEHKFFLWLTRYVSRYASVPTDAHLEQNGFPVPRDSLSGSGHYYLEEALKVCADRRLRKLVEDATNLLDTEDIQEKMNLLRWLPNHYNADRNPGTVLDDMYRDFLRGSSLHIPQEWLAHNLGKVPRGSIVVIAAQEGIGKTWLLLDMLRHAVERGRTAMLVSPEMGIQEIWPRLFTQFFKMPNDVATSGALSPGAVRHYKGLIASESMPNFSMLTSDREMLSVDHVSNIIHSTLPRIVFIDSFTLLMHTGYEAKWEAISALVTELKKLAITTGITVVLTAHSRREGGQFVTAYSRDIQRYATHIIGLTRIADQLMVSRSGGQIRNEDLDNKFYGLCNIIKTRYGRVGKSCMFEVDLGVSPIEVTYNDPRYAYILENIFGEEASA